MKKFIKLMLAALMAISCVSQANIKAADEKITISADKVYAYGNASGHDASKIVDGNKSTYWLSMPSNGEGSTTNEIYDSRMDNHYRYLDIELDGTYQISKIVVHTLNDNAYNNYYVYASDDADNYDKIISKTNNTKSNSDGDSYNVNVTASHLRLNMAFHSTGFQTNLAEIEVYGTKVSNEVPQPTPINVSDWQGSEWQKEWDKFESDQAYADRKVVNELTNLVGRVIGDEWKDSFTFQLRDEFDGNDVFTITDGEDGKILITGNDGVSLASGFNYYLKKYLNVDYNPLFESNVAVDKIVAVNDKIIKETQYDLRYALNFCTYSYTMSFWNWDEYEAFIDWAAMNGVNLMLDIVGQEEVLRQTFAQYGYSDREIQEYIPGPAFYAWFYMQNLFSYGGPLPSSWFESRVELGRQMHDRMQTYGISPVLQAFGGQVPIDFAQKNKGAVVTELKDWCNFSRPAVLQPYVNDGQENYYDKVADTFYAAQENVFGNCTKYYATDPFHEGGNPSGLDFALTYTKVQEAMLRADEDAVWVMQQWQGNLDANKLSGLVKPQQALALDLQADLNSQNGVMESYDVPWIWNMLHNFGGRMGLDANLPTIATKPLQDYYNKEDMVGIGITPEALENSPIAYELLFDMTWASDSINLEQWVNDYAARRAGGTSDELQLAYEKLLETAYAKKNSYYQGAAETVLNAKPTWSFGSASTWGHSSIFYDKVELEEALQLLIDCYDEFEASPAFRYDVADVAEQVLCNVAIEYHGLMKQAYNSRDLASFDYYSTKFLGVFDLSEQILGSSEEFMLGTWIEDARSMIDGADDWTKDLFEFNARALISTWAEERGTSLNDYSNRKWNGLTGQYYKARWEAWLANRRCEISGESKDSTNQAIENMGWFMYGWQWANQKSDDNNAFKTTADYSNLKENAQLVLDRYSVTALNAEGASANKIENVALNKPVSVSVASDSGNAADITDGNTGTYYVIKNNEPATFTLDLQGVYSVDEIIVSVNQGAGNYAYDYKLEVMLEDGSMTTIKEQTNGFIYSNTTFTINKKISKIVLTMKSRSDVLAIELGEIKANATIVEENTTTYKNVLQGLSATCEKGTSDDSNISYVTDGNTGNLWKSPWSGDIDSMYPDSVSVALDEATYVETIELYLEKTGLPFKFHVEVVLADDTTKTIIDKRDNTSVLDAALYTGTVNAEIKAVKVVFGGTTKQGAAGQASPAIAELKANVEIVENITYKNVLQGLSATCEKGTSSDSNISYVTDGNTTNLWKSSYSNDIDSMYPDSVSVALDETTYVESIELYLEKVGLPFKFHVEVVLADDTTKTIIDKRDNTSVLDASLYTGTVNAEIKAVKVVFDGTTKQGEAYLASPALSEIKALVASDDNDTTTSGINYSKLADELITMINKLPQGSEHGKYTSEAIASLKAMVNEFKANIADKKETELAKEFIALSANVWTKRGELVNTTNRMPLLNALSDAQVRLEWTADKALEDAYNDAMKVYRAQYVSDAQLADAQKALLEAYNNVDMNVDKEALKALYDANKDKKANEYQEETWDVFYAALTNALSVLENENASPKMVDAAMNQLLAGVEYLVKVGEVNKNELKAAYNANKDRVEADYRSETWAPFAKALENAKALIEADKATKEEVDAATKALLEAANNLLGINELPRLDEETLINKEANSIKVDSYSSQCGGVNEPTEGGYGQANCTIDHNNASYWHSNWASNNGELHTITYDLGKEFNVTDIKFLPRQNGRNGDIHKFKVYVGNSKNFNENTYAGEYEFAKDGTLNPKEWYRAYLTDNGTFTGRYVTIQITGSYGDSGNNQFASMAEIRFYGASKDVEPVVVDKTALNAAISEAEKVNKADYTDESVKALDEALSAAKALLANENATQDEVDAAAKALTNAISALVKKPVVNKTELEKAIKAAKDTDTTNKTAESIAALTSALSAAEKVLADEKATQADVDAAVKAINTAIANLKDVEVKPEYKGYDDVDSKAWYAGMVQEATIKGLMGKDGSTGNNFNPDGKITRGMVATVLYRMAGEPKVTYADKFSDVKDGLWYSNGIVWASEAKVVSGYANGKFGPDDAIKREDFAIMLRNYANTCGLNTKSSQSLETFKDYKAVSAYAKDAIAWCVENGLMSGSTVGEEKYLNPSANTTRAEAAKMFVQLSNLIKK